MDNFKDVEDAYIKSRDLYIHALHDKLKGQLVVDNNIGTGEEEIPLKITQFYDLDLLMKYLCLAEPGVTDVDYDYNDIELTTTEDWHNSRNDFANYGLTCLIKDSLSLNSEPEFLLEQTDGNSYTLKLSLIDLAHDLNSGS